MLLSQPQPCQSLRRSNSLAGIGSASLTLVGFEGQALWKMYAALEACAKGKSIQAVEVFIRSLEDVYESDSIVAPGLCMIKVPELTTGQDHRLALLLLSELSGEDAVTVIPVLKPSAPNSKVLSAIGRTCPAYLNSDSELHDFVAIFRSFLFQNPLESEAATAEPAEDNSQFLFSTY